MKRTEMYKALEGTKVVCMQNGRIDEVGIFHKGRMAFSITPFKPLKRTDASCTTYFLQKGDYIEDLGKCIMVRRGTNNYMFLFRA